MTPDPGERIDIRLERCPRCGELMPVRMEEGDRAPVLVRWSLRKSELCDHMIVDAFSVGNWASEASEPVEDPDWDTPSEPIEDTPWDPVEDQPSD